MSKAYHPDWAIVESYGVQAVAKRLGYDLDHGGKQRIYNWRRRGIPAVVKLEHPFLRKAKQGKEQA